MGLMRRFIVPTAITLLLLAMTVPALAEGKSSWKVYRYAPSDRALSSRHADATPDGLATFTFTAAPDTALLASERPWGPHTSILGRLIVAQFSISGAESFTYSGEGTPDNPCGTPATVRLYFNTNGAAAYGTDNDWYSKYWWSNNIGYQALGNGTFEIFAWVRPENWSNWNGQMGTARPEGFAAAASNPDLMGLSFGGGCFFENGVGATGNATFTLINMGISAP
jgi:hypothetical protein